MQLFIVRVIDAAVVNIVLKNYSLHTKFLWWLRLMHTTYQIFNITQYIFSLKYSLYDGNNYGIYAILNTNICKRK